MAPPMQPSHVHASPGSSEEFESTHCTPATRVSPLSPEVHGQNLKPAGFGMLRSKVPPAFILTGTQSNSNTDRGTRKTSSTYGQDPFLTTIPLTGTTQAVTESSKLSPNASAFTPGTLVDHDISNVASAAKISDFGLPSKDSDRDGLGYSFRGEAMPGYAPSRFPLHPHIQEQNTNGSFCKLGTFSVDSGTSRCLMVAPPLASKLTAKDVDNLINMHNFPSRTHIFTCNSPTTGTIYTRFADVRDAEKAHSWIMSMDHMWSVQYISPPEFEANRSPNTMNRLPMSVYEGQVQITATFMHPAEQDDIDLAGKIISKLLTEYGTVMAFELYPTTQLEVFYRVEFCDLRASEKALANLVDLSYDGFNLSIAAYNPWLSVDLHASMASSNSVAESQGFGLEKTFETMTINGYTKHGPQTPHTPASSSFQYHTPSTTHYPVREFAQSAYTPSSLTSFSTNGFDRSHNWSPSYNSLPGSSVQSPVWSSFGPGTIGQERGVQLHQHARPEYYGQYQRGPSTMVLRRPYDRSSGHHNTVDIARIRGGTDVRTTIMLRNIPNKIDQAMLKEIIDDSSFGKYDFMYLRIDFANNCNVGYAFINFDSPDHIIEFVTRRAGQRWNRYNSDKIAEVSYATIQGRDCLIQKFRNSSVMMEHESFRPKIFHTTGPKKGEEDKFPGPDNDSKMRRSVENAAHVGLFAPRAGQSFRDEQRRRRSQYDRGTRLAEIEDAYQGHLANYRNRPSTLYAGAAYGQLSLPF